MSILVDAARIIANLLSLSQDFRGITDPKSSGEFRAANVTSISADAAFTTVSAFTAATPREGEAVMNAAQRNATAARLSPILWALTIVEVLELTTGLGSPHEGDDLKAGSEQFAKVYEQLGKAFPDDSWTGKASLAYATQTFDLQDLAKKMQELDAKLAGIVKDHAAVVTHIRLGFGILKDLLFAAFIIEIIMKFAPALGPTASQTFAKIVAGLGVGAALVGIGALSTFSLLSAQKVNGVNGLAGDYGAVAAGAKPSDTSLAEKAQVPAAEQSTVSSFEDISAGMPKMSAPPAAPGLAGVASGSKPERPLLSTLTGEGAAEAPSTPRFTTPTLAQLAAMSGQTAKLSGQLSHANVVNQAMGQIQQLASMAHQGKGAAAPAKVASPKEEAALAGAAPAEAAERAPIEAAPVGAPEAPEPSPVQRNM